MNYKGKKDEKHYCMNCGKLLEFKGYSHKYKYCDNKCQNEYEHNKCVNEWLAGTLAGHCNDVNCTIKGFVREYLFKLHDNKCEKCGWNNTNPFTSKIPLTVHHKDGNCANSILENLELVCPNCHSLTETYGSKNKGKSRRQYKTRS